MVEKFVKTLKEAKNPPSQKEKNNNKSDNNIETTDVTYLKGVGPKVAYLFNKIGIFTIFDYVIVKIPANQDVKRSHSVLFLKITFIFRTVSN